MKVKVAHVTTVDISLEDLLLNQLCSLQTAGYDVTGISSPGSRVPRIEGAGIRHLGVPMNRNLSPLEDVVSLWRLYRLMRRERFTIVHTHTPKAGLLGQLAARLAGVPIVINTLHGLYFHEHMRPLARRFFVLMEQAAARCSHSILSQNAEDIETVIREKICPPEKIKYLGNGIDLTRFNPAAISLEATASTRQKLALPPNAPIVGFVGRLAARRKGFLDFLAACRAVADELPEARFLIVGDTDRGKPDAVEPAAAADFGIASKCIFLGHLTNAELPPLFQLMEVLVLPSLAEGLPRVVMEASAMGVPCVATNVKGNREAVADGETGTLVPLAEVAALTGAILQILREKEVAERMRAAARRHAAERFDEEIVFDKVKAEYVRLLKENEIAPLR